MASDAETTEPFRILMLGDASVGKTALAKCYLTKHYSGEYETNADKMYQQRVAVENKNVPFTITDVSGETRDLEFPLKLVRWAEVCFVVYDVNHKPSFWRACELVQRISRIREIAYFKIVKPIVALIGNKTDIKYQKKVGSFAAQEVAREYGCFFAEVSAAENCDEVAHIFDKLLLKSRRRAWPLCALAPRSWSCDSASKASSLRRFCSPSRVFNMLRDRIGGAAGGDQVTKRRSRSPLPRRSPRQ